MSIGEPLLLQSIKNNLQSAYQSVTPEHNALNTKSK